MNNLFETLGEALKPETGLKSGTFVYFKEYKEPYMFLGWNDHYQRWATIADWNGNKIEAHFSDIKIK